MNALQVECAIRRHTQGTILIPEAPVRYVKESNYKAGYYGDYFADFMLISASEFATELEVKVSLGDWRNDLKKPKWTAGAFPVWVTRFIYVVPIELGIPDWVPAQAGIWHIKHEGKGFPRVVVARAPKRMGKERVPSDVRQRWMSSLYHRYWNMRMERFETKNAKIQKALK